jgi:hypothetical protein
VPAGDRAGACRRKNISTPTIVAANAANNAVGATSVTMSVVFTKLSFSQDVTLTVRARNVLSWIKVFVG